MILENFNIFKEKILNTIQLYKKNNEILDEITINKNCYSNEEIENIKDAIIEQNKNIMNLKKTILDLKKAFNDHNVNNDIIENIYKLDLLINKFWYKFYSKFKSKDKILNHYWRTEYLECYKNQFFKNKILDINEINSTKLVDISNQSLTNGYQPNSPQI
ncbi:hypothetical protein [Spiroplasma endosymbiont of Polydrusus pterygomalis]|uniref:hypothetical protein n=1 Tax=Spiroplasma endosymbiont of Polydrusus pterygomalis TaxID=3139327 RepID=UPI003CCB7200